MARMRIRHRTLARSIAGRPPTSPIAAAHLSERPACVIGSRRSEVDAIADLIEELTAADVDRLDLSRRGLDLLGRRNYGLIVLDAHADDPVAFMNQLARSLSSTRHRDCAVVVRHDSGDARPALEHAVRMTSASRMDGPIDAALLLEAVAEAGAFSPLPAAAGES